MCVFLILRKIVVRSGQHFSRNIKKPLYVRIGWVGGLNQKRTHAYRVGGLVKNVMILTARTLLVPLTTTTTHKMGAVVSLE